MLSIFVKSVNMPMAFAGNIANIQTTVTIAIGCLQAAIKSADAKTSASAGFVVVGSVVAAKTIVISSQFKLRKEYNYSLS